MTSSIEGVTESALSGAVISDAEALALVDSSDLELLLNAARQLRDQHYPQTISYSRKIFIPLTQLCRDVCHYCTFAHPPRRGQRAFLTPEQILDIARAGQSAGCREALFTLGDKPELRYRVARDELKELGYATTLDYLAAMAELVFKETGLLPHLNPGVMGAEDIAKLRTVSVSQGIMLESISPRLAEKGRPHYGSPDKKPSVRLETIRLAGEAAVPFTSGILIGIGETRRERIESLLALRELHQQYGHIQEIIIQNFRAKTGTKMVNAEEPELDDHLWTIAVARLILGGEMHIQAPPNLRPGALQPLIDAGIDDWGGVSPVTPDHVNPEAPWPELELLARETATAGKVLVQRLAIYPDYLQQPERWLTEELRTPVRRLVDIDGFAREDDWVPGALEIPPQLSLALQATQSGSLTAILQRALNGERLDETAIVSLFQARGADFTTVCQTADQLRREVCGNIVSYTVNRNINYTNICYFRCQFCAFSKGKMSENLRGRPYDLDHAEIARRSAEAWARGATEVCMQGGIHPEYTGQTYIDICRTVKAVAPEMHIHAFSPLEIWQGAETLGISLEEFLCELKAAGLSTLPGTAAEILDDEVRRIICPDKINTEQWLQVMETAHRVGLRSTATIMYGHVDKPIHWARHLLRIRDLQARTGGFTEFVPLPFVPMEAPIYLKGKARRGPTFREAVLIHAVARLVLHPHIANIQTSWVKMGPDGVKVCLNAGANDLGGTLMNETITRSAGASHGQEMAPQQMEGLILSLDREPLQRTTLYQASPLERINTSFVAAPLTDVVNTPPSKSRSAIGLNP